GGIGMSGIAELMINWSYSVTGSDILESEITNHLKDSGAVIYTGHNAENIGDADMLVYSSAVNLENPEIKAAQDKNILVIRRAEMLGEIMRRRYSVAVAGTHGKTTTTSMIGLVLTEGEFDPTLIIGGKVKSIKSNVKLGEGMFLVAEADEFDRTFLKLIPTFAVITTIESEHLDCYKNLDDIKDAFVEFANKVPFFGTVTVCIDEPGVKDIVHRIKRRVSTYGTSEDAELRAESMEYKENKTTFNVFYKGDSLGAFSINSPGVHNVKNALSAISIGLELDIPVKKIRSALSNFSGVHRRFEIKANINDIIIADDYAHHPTEIKATLKAAKNGWNRRIIAIFQPHLYSRTRDFYEMFGQSFSDSDILIVTKIYPAREQPINGVTGKLISDSTVKNGHKNAFYIPEENEIISYIKNNVKPNDIVMTIGAGSIWQLGEKIINILKKESISADENC
ncbi:UDP-N-acetylmuramate--L-alanine ligase, partial [bacterium]|nr:UDP-N-acetylmuramate--L-alanine ligase [bacterium]